METKEWKINVVHVKGNTAYFRKVVFEHESLDLHGSDAIDEIDEKLEGVALYVRFTAFDARRYTKRTTKSLILGTMDTLTAWLQTQQRYDVKTVNVGMYNVGTLERKRNADDVTWSSYTFKEHHAPEHRELQRRVPYSGT